MFMSFKKVYELCFWTMSFNNFLFLLFLPCEWLMQAGMGDNLKPDSLNPEEPGSSRAQKARDDIASSLDRRESNELSDSSKARQKYKDVADAAQAAFESAAYAAAAARAAVELSRSNGSCSPDGPSSPSPRKIDTKPVKAGQEPESIDFNSKTQARTLSDSSLDSQKETYADANDEVDDLPREPVTEATSHISSVRQIPSTFQAGLNVEANNDSPLRLNLGKGPVSVRTRRLQGY